MITIGQVAQWIIANRRGKAFCGYSIEKVFAELTECENSMLCVTDESGIIGVVCCRDDREEKVLYVYDILTTKLGVVKKMMKYFHTRYSGYQIQGTTRSGRKRVFKNTVTLENKL